MQRKIYLIRHGSSEYNEKDVLSGMTNVSISTLGENQAKQLSTFFERLEIQRIFASPLKRAQQTAELVFPMQKCNIKIIDGLSEIDYGDYEGFDRTKYSSTEDAVIKSWLNKPSSLTFPGGSSVSGHADQAFAAFLETASEYPNGNLALVSHRATIRLVISKLIGLDLDRFRSIPCSPASVTIINQTDQNFYLETLNLTMSYFIK